MAVLYRHFRNPDTPALSTLWNQSLTSRGSAFIAKPSIIEAHICAKPWFDPKGLIVAVDAEANPSQNVVGAVLTGFGCTEDKRRLDPRKGIVSCVLVHPLHRRQGIGTKLLELGEGYLSEQGTVVAQAGSSPDRTPYLWGLHGGGSPCGALSSDVHAHEFLKARGYQAQERSLVLSRDFEKPAPMGDPRFPSLRRKYEMRFSPRRVTSCMDEALQGAIETVVFELHETAIDKPVAQICAWDMAFFAIKRKTAQAGLYGLVVHPEMRGQGLGKYLLALALQHLQDQMYGQAESVIPADHLTAEKLLTQFGFTVVDEGWTFSKQLM